MSLATGIIPWMDTTLVIHYYSHDWHKRKREPQLRRNTKTLFRSRRAFQDGNKQSIKPSVGPSERRCSCVPRSWPCPPRVLRAERWWRGLRGWFYKSPFPVPLHMCILHSATDFRTLEFRPTPKAARNSMRGIQIQSQPPNQRPGQAGTLDKLEQRSHPSFALFSYSLCL